MIKFLTSLFFYSMYKMLIIDIQLFSNNLLYMYEVSKGIQLWGADCFIWYWIYNAYKRSYLPFIKKYIDGQGMVFLTCSLNWSTTKRIILNPSWAYEGQNGVNMCTKTWGWGPDWHELEGGGGVGITKLLGQIEWDIFFIWRWNE